MSQHHQNSSTPPYKSFFGTGRVVLPLWQVKSANTALHVPQRVSLQQLPKALAENHNAHMQVSKMDLIEAVHPKKMPQL
jgi:hypothetical protein